MRAEVGPYRRINDNVLRPESDAESSAKEMARHTMESAAELTMIKPVQRGVWLGTDFEGGGGDPSRK